MATSTFPRTFNPHKWVEGAEQSRGRLCHTDAQGRISHTDAQGRVSDMDLGSGEEVCAALPAPADAVVISDLHLGSDNCQAKPLAAFLENLLEHSGGQPRPLRLIINGDVFDSIDFRRLKKNHWKVLSLIRHLSDKLEVIWIAGNHDGSADIISHLLGVTVAEQYILMSGGKRILIVHGHAFDNFIEHHPILTWLADCAYWCLQKIDRSHYVARLAKTRSKTFIRCNDKIRTGACQLALRLHCHAAICGHTHLPEALEGTAEQTVAYYNSGSWTENPSSWLTIQGGVIGLHRTCMSGSIAGGMWGGG